MDTPTPQPQGNTSQSPHWTIGSIPPECTRVDVRTQKGAARMMNLPPQLQVISLGLVADCLAQGFIFEEIQAKTHELLFEAMSMVMRLYLMLFFLEPTNIENMVTLFHQQPNGSIPPLSTATLALKDGVLFDAPEVSQAIVETNPTAVVWMSISVPEGQESYVVSFKALTPSLIANVDITFRDSDIDLKTVVDPRYPDFDPFHYVSLVPILNLDEYLDDEEDEDESEAEDSDVESFGDGEEVAELPIAEADEADDDEPPFQPDAEVVTSGSEEVN